MTTASTTAERASSAPATSVVLTAEDLHRYGFRSIAEAINFLSLGMVTSDGLRSPDIGSRGVLLSQDDGKHVLLLVNGHAINDPLYGAARFDEGAGIPLDMVDRVEVILGPGSVLYGSNAMLGVINVITKSADAYQGGHVLADYEPGRSWRAGAGTGFKFDLFGSSSEITGGLEHYQRFGPDLEFARQSLPIDVGIGRLIPFRRGVPADGIWGGELSHAYFTNATSGLLRLRSGEFDVTLQANVYRRGIPYMMRGLNVDYDDPNSYERDRALRLDVKHQATLSSLVQLSSRVYADGFDYRRKTNRDAFAGCFRADFSTCSYYTVGLTRWAGIEERLSFNWFGDQRLVTLLGVDARERWASAKQDAIDYDTERAFAPTLGRLGDGSEHALLVSPYVQQTYSPLRWLDLNAGARLDIDERFSPVLSPRAAAAITPFSGTTLRAVYSQAFRTPTWSESDITSYQVARSSRIKPEIARSIEGSLEQRFGAQRLMFGVFYTRWERLVSVDPLTNEEMGELQRRGELPITANGLLQYANEGQIKNYGWNGAWDGSLLDGKLAYGVNATAAYTRRTQRDRASELLDVAPRFFGNARVAYAFGGYLPSPALAAYYVTQRPAYSAFDGNYVSPPFAPALAEFRFTLTGKAPLVPGLSYRASAAYASASHSAYAVGPYSMYFTVPAGQAALTPVDQFRFFVGLRYDFGRERATQGSEE